LGEKLAARIFISHHGSRHLEAEQLCAFLETRGHPCWMAPRDIRPGRDWAGAILDGIDGSSVMLVLESREAFLSGHVDREVSYAVSRGKPIVRVKLPGPGTGASAFTVIPDDSPEVACTTALPDCFPGLLEVLGRTPRWSWRKVILASSAVIPAAVALWFLLPLRWDRPVSGWPEDIAFAEIPSGSFDLGSPEDEPYRWQGEGPQVPVRVEGFEMMTTEVTQDMWTGVMGTTQTQLIDIAGKSGIANFLAPAEGGDLPVVMVSWSDAAAFAESLSHLDTLHVYRLPTEAEWEYACRAGCDGALYAGDGGCTVDDVSWNFGNSGGSAHPVAGLEPNAWGLYDMLGNVSEWCLDPWRPDHSGSPGSASDTIPGETGFRVRKGSSFVSSPRLHRCAFRDMARENLLHQSLGFRVLRLPR
jgi:formylglycine-generating enzyme required for sulfatase activity